MICFVFISNSCQQKNELAAKKEELATLQKEQQAINSKIEKVRLELAKLDPEFGKSIRKATLITTMPVKNNKFEHYVEVSGSVYSKKNVVLSAENTGNIIRVNVIEGDEVKKGSVIASQDSQLLQKQLEQLQTQYELANELFKKQTKLWERNIGTEVQYLEAKNRKENLEQQIANVKTQISKSNIRAPFSGTIEKVFINVGEIAPMGSPVVQIVNHLDVFVSADLSESYVGSFSKGDEVIIEFPSINQSISSRISAIGQVIDDQNRTFKVEARLNNLTFKVKPNLLAVVKLKDFEKENAAIVPTNLIQQDKNGEFVYIVDGSDDNVLAKKTAIKRGQTYKNETLVLNGLQGSEMLINDGFRDVTDGSLVRIVENVL